MSDLSPDSPSLSPSLINKDQCEVFERHYPRASYWFNILPTHPFIHGPAMPSQTQLQGPAVPPPYLLQGMLPNPDGVVRPDTAPSTQQPYHDVNMTESIPNIDISIPLNTGVRPAHQAASAAHPCHDKAVNDNQDPPTSMSFASELQELKNKLDCEKHGKFCYINPISGDHEAQDIYNLTLWAKKIFFGEATYEKPPEMAAFDHVLKKR
ncbi:hypothetical protein EDB19DRAFT_1906696 [Suillus lakei]|nr:hypothetical protein EDB19DRAFT_1906696 [Suillus lakei]